MTAWSYATLRGVDPPLMDAIASRSVATILEFAPLDLANTAWSYATLQLLDEPLLSAIACASLRTMGAPGFTAQALANIAWAYANVRLHDGPLLNAIAEASIARISQCKAQDLANLSWSFAALSLRHTPLLASIAESSVKQISQFTGQGLSNSVWAFATIGCFDEPLLDAIAAAAMSLSLHHQELSNMAWAFATLQYLHEPLLDSIASASVRKIGDFKTRHLANTAWSFAVMKYHHRPLIAAISAAAMPIIKEMSPLSLASTAWASAQLAYLDRQLLTAIAESSLATLSQPESFDDGVAGMALWAFSQLDDLSLAWQLADCAQGASSLSLGALLGACERRSMVDGELTLWRRLARGGLSSVAATAEVLRLMDAGRLDEACRVLKRLEAEGLSNPASQVLWRACGSGGQLAAFQMKPPHRQDPHDKELRLLAYVLTHAKAGDARSVCTAIEEFGRDVLMPAGQWLKVAGDEKAAVLADALGQAVPLTSEEGLSYRVLEVGTYCGFSAISFVISRPRCQVVSIEAEPARVAIARSVVAFAGVSHLVEVCTGHSQDVLPWLAAKADARAGSLAKPGFNAVFLDQCGGRFGSDLRVLEASGLLAPGAVVVADNVLKPGAPAYLWHVVYGGSYETEIVSVEEFAMPGTEDWMSVSRYWPVTRDAQAAPPKPPSVVRRLEWEADRMRMRAQDSVSGPGVSFADWAAFSERMRASLAELGISPRPPIADRAVPATRE
mmetsp:Transcript_109610/g.353704  ORF Transcript_109610/g.353704 Transcript_109610/m.353704 type:complete len:730 (-) Transcript_109610:43-2232(-)